MNVLIKFRHGLGDAVQLTCVLEHLKHYHPDWNVDVAALLGKHSAFRGLCRRTYILDRDQIPNSRYERVFAPDWHECEACYRDWPSTKAERCLLEVFGLRPFSGYCRYAIHPEERSVRLARQYLKSIVPQGPSADGRFPIVLIHYEGNTSRESEESLRPDGAESLPGSHRLGLCPRDPRLGPPDPAGRWNIDPQPGPGTRTLGGVGDRRCRGDRCLDRTLGADDRGRQRTAPRGRGNHDAHNRCLDPAPSPSLFFPCGERDPPRSASA